MGEGKAGLRFHGTCLYPHFPPIPDPLPHIFTRAWAVLVSRLQEPGKEGVSPVAEFGLSKGL